MRGVLFLLLHPRRLLTLVAGLVVGSLYVWFASIRAVPGVRRRKAALREAWRSRDRKRRSPA
ncbi:MAG TPA: hypothetical protein VI409_00470 [Gaiellaceae bacterium]|nr:hypothetical protein [Gaiellaceae bacterium]